MLPEIIFTKEELIEKYNFLYGNDFPKAKNISKDPDKQNTLKIQYNDTWIAYFTFNGPRNYQLVF